MTEFSRRRFVSTTAAGTTALWLAGSRTAWASPPVGAAGPASSDPYENTVRAAAMTWRRLPTGWQEAPFLANGHLGALLYAGATPNTLKLMLSHSQVQDQRGQWRGGIGFSRLPVGYFTLTLAGEITAVDWTLDLYDAELRGTVTTTRGSLAFCALIHNDTGALLLSTRPTAGEEAAAWTFQWLPAATTRTSGRPADYTPNPAPRVGDGFVEQPLLAGGGWTTAWRERREGTGRLLAAHLVYRFPGEPAEATSAALRAVDRTLATDPDRLVDRHRDWWHAYYRRSFLSVPDKRLQSFYVTQLYKLASATRARGPVISEWGPWFPEVGNNWTAVWWNLNVQIGMAPVHGSNHPELDSVTHALRRFEHHLPASVPAAYRDGESYALGHPSDWQLRAGDTYDVGIPGSDRISDNFGNLTWALHHVWLAYRHSMDPAVLRDVVYPILAKAITFYAHFLREGSDGRLHLLTTRSPEYADAADCTYDLSLIRWGVRTLIGSAELLRHDDPRLGRWRDIGRRLAPYAEDPAAGVMIGKDVPLAASHRHHSHLLWLHPLRERNWDRAPDRAVMRRSMDHWVSMRELWHGYSYATASSMYSVMDEPEKALDFLTFFTDLNVVADCAMTVNTMYREGRNLALESPLSAAQSMLDMVVQGHDGVVKVFPSLSRRWADASIASLRTQGAFLVDADRSGGLTRWVRVRSEAGAPLTLEHSVEGEIDVRDGRGHPVRRRETGPGRITLDVPRGGTVLITPRGSRRPETGPREVPSNGAWTRWGLPD
ncbi:MULTISPECIES: glycosyl hydrolase family 95 catalytic domain-containing protein [unclassified Streptomyces]|uniref:glycosyl hydrolase family 95 catalytic domain-containing protein n=1 Tax=Streptomyces sp. NPDC127532 TaxID=3345399 RepID=UPI00363FC609